MANARRVTVLCAVPLGAALFAGGVTPVAQASGQLPAQPTVECVDSAEGADAASVIAVACGLDVEVLDARSEWASTYVLPDGSMRLDTSIAAVRTDVSGEWEPVDSSVVAGDGGLVVASAVAPMTFSDGSDGAPLARIVRDGHEVVFDAPFDLPAPSVDGSQVTYAEVLPGVDLVVTVNEDATGFSEVLRVESAQAAANPALDELTFDVQTSEGIELEASDGGFVAADASGEAVFTSPVPTMWDSGSAPALPTWVGGPGRSVGSAAPAVDPAVAPAPGAEVAVMAAEVASGTVTITPHADILADRGTVWPVFIDPGMSGSLNQRTAVRTAFGSAYNFAGDEGVGLCDRGATTSCSQTFRSRVLWQFAGLQALGNLEPSDVQSAVFAATGTHSYSCTPAPVTLYAVADFDAGTVYPGGGYWQPIQSQNITHRAGCGAGKEPRRIEFDATWQALAVATANTGLASFGMAADEGSMASWKRYAWDATFSVSYNRPPSTPVNARTTAPDSACVSGAFRPAIRSATPVLRGVLHDPDGGNVHPRFVIDDIATGGRVWDTAWMAAQGSGAEHAVGVPSGVLGDGRAYRWSVAGGDGVGASPWASCEFVVDLTAPPTPGVDAVAGVQATYTQDTTTGGVGQPGLFRFSAAGATDVDRFLFSLNSQALNMSVPGDTPQAMVTPTTIGTQALYVQAVDRAGHTSPIRMYRFTVAFATISDAWQLDETAGTSAGNVANRANPLVVSPGVTRVPGVVAELGGATSDRALQFDAAGDTADAGTPVVRTDSSYSVMATVRTDQATRAATAVSQDGAVVSGFELGLADQGCPEVAPCWALSVPSSDSADASRVVAASATPVVPGQWVQLTGMRDASTGTVRLAVCTLGSATTPGDMVPGQTAPVGAGSGWLAGYGFQVGRGKAAGAAANSWLGAIGQVRTYTGPVAIEQLRTSCRNPAAISPTLNPPPPAPTPARNASGIDLDGNGKADVFWNSPNDGRWRVSFDGRTSWTAINGAGVLPSSWYRFGDVDGDGRDDVFLAHPDGRWLVSYSGTTGWVSLGQDTNAAGNVKLGDLNGDGKDDVFWAWAHDGNWRVQYAGTSGWTIINNGGPLGTERFQLADVNGDGKDDVFLSNSDGRWMVSYGGTTGWDHINSAGEAPGQVLVR